MPKVSGHEAACDSSTTRHLLWIQGWGGEGLPQPGGAQQEEESFERVRKELNSCRASPHPLASLLTLGGRE